VQANVIGSERAWRKFVKEPRNSPWGEFAIFKDPDGNQFGVSSS